MCSRGCRFCLAVTDPARVHRYWKDQFQSASPVGDASQMDNTAPAQSVPPNVEMSMPVVALPVASVTGGLNADQLAKQPTAPGQPVVMNLSAQQQPQKHSVAI